MLIAGVGRRNTCYNLYSTVEMLMIRNGPAVVDAQARYLSIFIARQHTDARYSYSKSVCPSVRLSVRYVPVPAENGLTYRHSYFTIR